MPRLAGDLCLRLAAALRAPAQRPHRAAAALLVAALAVCGTLAVPRASANPANIYVINEHVATALNGGTPPDLTTVAGRAAPGVLTDLAAFDAASAGQVANDNTHSGPVVILVRTDGSTSDITVNGRGLICTPACDGITGTAPDADGYLAFTVTGTGVHVIGDTFVATVVQDSVSLDSSAVHIVGHAHNFQFGSLKSTIQAGATSCTTTANTSAPSNTQLVATYTDIDGNPVVGYIAAFAPLFGTGGNAGVAASSSVSMLLPGGSTIAAADIACGNTAGPQDLSATAVAGEISGLVTDLTRTLSITVTGVPATIALTASPAAIDCNGTSTSTVVAKVTDSAGNNVVDGTPVTFSVVALGTANPINTVTSGGTATSTITPLSGDTSGVVVTVTADSAASSIRIDCLPATTGPDSSTDPVLISRLPFTDLLNTSGFTTEPGEPLPCGNMGATAWFELSLPVANVAITVDTIASNFNTALAVYTQPPASPPGGFSLLHCNAAGANSTVSFVASTPGTYFIQAGGLAGATGNLVLNVRCTGDADCDGLSDSDEALLGTNPNVADTDGDGLSDGLEVHTFHTNPLVGDTDKDGCGDGAELALSPPLDPTDPWDFYSVPVPALFVSPDPTHDVRGTTISASNAQAVFAYFRQGAVSGTTVYDQDLDGNGVEDGVQYDRTVAAAGISGPPDGVIAASDAELAFAQFRRGYAC